MEHLKEIRAAKECFTQLTKELNQDQVDWVLNLFETEHDTAEAFQVHRTTVDKWVRGINKPNGRNKMAFYFLLNMYHN